MAERVCDYLIIGNSAAGVSAAEAIRSRDGQGSIIIVSREPYAAYGRPLISYMIEGKTQREVMDLKAQDFYERNAIEALLGSDYEVDVLDAAAHRVHLRCGDEISYGRCLLATGSMPFVPPTKGIGDRANVYPFITLDDANAAWSAVVECQSADEAAKTPSRVVVIGAGLIGLKAAEALIAHVDEVVVLELADRILPTVLDDDGAAIVQECLQQHGIICMPGVTAEELIGEGDRVVEVALTNGERLSCDFVIAAVGVRPNSALAVAAGAEQGRGLVVDDRLRTTLPDVYAAGDVVEVHDRLDGSKHPLALWPNATAQGRVAGIQMADPASDVRFKSSYAINAVDFFDLSMLTAGIINPAPDSGCEVNVSVDGHVYTKFVTRDDRLVGYILINRPDNAGIYTALIEEAIPLSSLDPELFTRPPRALDFPSKLRWRRFHEHYPADRDRRGWKEATLHASR